MRIASAARALPDNYYPQATLIEAFRKYWGTRLDRFEVLERLHAATQVEGRYLAMPIEQYPLATWGEANNKWIEVSLDLGEQAIRGALDQSGINAEQIGAFFFVSITGVCSPSIE